MRIWKRIEFGRDLLGSRSVIDALNLDQAGAGASDVTGSLVAQVTSPM